MLGLAFKPETDDMREAPSIKIAHLLGIMGANVTAYDPVATINAKKVLGDRILYAQTLDEAILDAEAAFIITEWNEIKQMDLTEILKKMKHPIIFDGRNCLDENKLKACENVEYYPIGKPEIIKNE